MLRLISIELHAQAAEIAGAREAELELAAGATGADVKRVLGERYPGLRELLPVSIVASEQEYLGDGAEIGEGTSRLHLVPPVSGG